MSEDIVVVASIPAKDGDVDGLLAAFQSAVPAVHAEDGCLRYAPHRGEDAVWVIEHWASPAALEAHGKGDAMAAVGKAIGAYVGGRPTIHRLAPAPAGDADKGSV
ncbi:MAG TPA: putative quinol monooxygenase [Mycobacteriales bacterium]